MDVQSITLAIVVAFLWGILPLFHKVLLKKISFKSIMLISSLVNIVFVLIFSFIYRKEIIADKQAWKPKSIVLIGFIALTTIFLANILYYTVLKTNPSYIVTVITYSAPIFTLIGAIFILKEHVTKVSLVGAFLIICGILLIGIGFQSDEKFALKD